MTLSSIFCEKAFVVVTSVPTGNSINTLMYFGSVFGKKTTLGGNIFINKNDNINKPVVPKKNT